MDLWLEIKISVFVWRKLNGMHYSVSHQFCFTKCQKLNFELRFTWLFQTIDTRASTTVSWISSMCKLMGLNTAIKSLQYYIIGEWSCVNLVRPVNTSHLRCIRPSCAEASSLLTAWISAILTAWKNRGHGKQKMSQYKDAVLPIMYTILVRWHLYIDGLSARKM